MDDRHIKLVEAAHTVFARYGYGKSTMHDIAREAGVARQTLYNVFASKEDVLRASVRYYVGQTMQAVQHGWEESADFGDRLDIFFTHGPLAWYDKMQSSPDLADMLDGINAAAQQELAQVGTQWTDKFENLIRETAAPGSVAHDRAADLAGYIYATALNAKYQAPDRDTLVRRLEMLKLSVVALLNQSPGPRRKRPRTSADARGL